jgi:hypothetical protein
MPKKDVTDQETVKVTTDHPKERLEYKKLLAINPNYFGTLKDSPLKAEKVMTYNTTYEELTCIGYNPAQKLLEGTIQIKLPGGYNGNLCMDGSAEHVRFYINYGAGWVDLGIASVNVHDIVNQPDCEKKNNKPLSYVVTLAISPEEKNCKQPVTPLIRGILSWNKIPTAGMPDEPPTWGNVLEQHIQLKKRDPNLVDVFEHFPKEKLKELPPHITESLSTKIPVSPSQALGTLQLAKLYADTKKAGAVLVEPHRFGLKQIQAVITLADGETIQKTMAEWKFAGIDWAGAIKALDKTKADVSYEELYCLGLEYHLERLVATFRIKRPCGYSGDLCTDGSPEYVAFWADWNNTCKWTYLKTVAINVHDIATIPKDGLSFSAILPVDLSAVRQPCEPPDGGPKIGRIRAVLSWSSPPSTFDPDALTHWGNRIDTHVQIQPGKPVPGTKPVITLIGGINVGGIDTGSGKTKPNARFADGGDLADPYLGRDCPFGGKIIVNGPPRVGFKYKLMARKVGDPGPGDPVKTPFLIVDEHGVGYTTVTPDPMTGFVNYWSEAANFTKVLAHWIPTGNEKWEIWLELDTGETTDSYFILLDNTAPRRKPYLAPFEPPEVTCDIHIDSGGDCNIFTKGDLLKGRFVACDPYPGHFSLTTLPSSLAPPNPTTPTPFTSNTSTFAAGGDEWTLNTATMKKCGYVILLQVWDRSIINSQPGHNNYNSYDVGFCLKE